MAGLFFESGIDKGFEEDLKRINNQVNGLASNVQGQGNAMDNTFKRIGQTIGAFFAVDQILNFGKAIIDTRAEFQKFSIVLENTLGNKVAADNALEMVAQIAAETPFALTELSDAFIRLTNQGLQPTRAELVKMGDLASSTGKGFLQLSEAILDAQTGQFERLKEFGIKAKKEGDKVVFTFKEQETTVANTSTAIKDYIVGLGGLEGIMGANAKIAESLSGQISNLGDNWDQLLNQMGTSTEGIIGGTLKTLNKYLGELAAAFKKVNDPHASYLNKLEEQSRVISKTNPLMAIFNGLIDKNSNSFLKMLPGMERSIQKFKEFFAVTKGAPSVAGVNPETLDVTKQALEILKAKVDAAKQTAVITKEISEKEQEDRRQAYKKGLDDFTKNLNEQKKEYENYNNSLKGLTGTRRDIVDADFNTLKAQGKTYLAYLEGLLLKEKDLNKRRILDSEIASLKSEQLLVEQQNAEKLHNETQANLDKLVALYATYSSKRKAIEEKGVAEALALRAGKYEAEALLAEQATQNELKKLDESIVNSDEKFKAWFSTSLPQIAKAGVEALQQELNRLKVALAVEGLEPEKVVVYRAQIDALNKQLMQKNSIEVVSKTSWKDTLEVMNGVNELAKDIIGSFDGLSEGTKAILTGLTQTASGVINLVNGLKAVEVAAGGIEKASAVLAVLGTVIKIVSAVSGAFQKAREERVEAHVAEIQQIQAANLELVKQNALYREGNELFSDDKWGTALAGLSAYSKALVFQAKLQKELAGAAANATSPSFAGMTLLQKALSQTFVKTNNRSDVANALGILDEYESLLKLYPEVIKASGELDTAKLKEIIDTRDLGDADEARLNGIIELTDEAQSAFAQYGDYLASTFSGVGDNVSKAFQDMYEGGADAMTSLESSFSDMIESFTRDAIEFAFLQPLLDTMNETAKALGVSYAKGDISAEELQQGIVDTLGTFYDQIAVIEPKINEAFKIADEMAAAAGFDSAFNSPDSGDAEAKKLADEQAALEAAAAAKYAEEQAAADAAAAEAARLAEEQAAADAAAKLAEELAAANEAAAAKLAEELAAANAAAAAKLAEELAAANEAATQEGSTAAESAAVATAESTLEDLQKFIDKNTVPVDTPALVEAQKLSEPTPVNAVDTQSNVPKEPIPVETVTTAKSTAGQIAQNISEETGTILSGRLGAIMISNEKLVNFSADALEYAVQNLLYMKAIKTNTDYLPEIAANTRKTYEKLESI